MTRKNAAGDILENAGAAVDVVIAVAPLVPVPILTNMLSVVNVIVVEAKVLAELKSFSVFAVA